MPVVLGAVLIYSFLLAVGGGTLVAALASLPIAVLVAVAIAG